MKLLDSVQLRLQLELALWRYGWRLPAVLVVLCLGLVVWLYWVPAQVRRADHALQQLQLAQQNASMKISSSSRPASPLLAFHRVLRPQDESTAQLRLIFKLAADARLNISQVDMRRQPDPSGSFSQMQIVLPVRGSYLNIKTFCLELLQALPSLSIDQLVLKSEPSSTGNIEAQITLSLWQQPEERAVP